MCASTSGATKPGVPHGECVRIVVGEHACRFASPKSLSLTSPSPQPSRAVRRMFSGLRSVSFGRGAHAHARDGVSGR
tara:strand:+ start:397 stop:627 length:231 start_codon:yes stop_codon:yes gene_type:complete